eukprot:TRINITY_DN42188_c1_g1_i1.p1 TRINITY_DN42188_c1_g1~~TRINITY_DN42188_c1_g1_i1.p1  ORF type:complete len:181 (-),score=1.54 TRINITY_DN42188_c1_g1_i1:117-584(-)
MSARLFAGRAAMAVCQRRVAATPVRQARTQASLADMIVQKNAENPVMVYSKSYCPFCAETKGLFRDLEVDAKVVELDQIHEGVDIQQELQRLTGSRTVPQVFVGGEYIGGNSETQSLHRSGNLRSKLDAAGVSHNQILRARHSMLHFEVRKCLAS